MRKEVGYKREETLRHDILSITAIYRLRKGQRMYQIERCKAIFLTTNVSLANACAKFFYEEFGGPSVPLCIVEHVLATIAWVKKPMKAPNLPVKKLIADCYAALNPSDSLWRKYLEEVERQRAEKNISENDYFMLRYSIEARQALMDITQGDPDAFSEGTVEEVLEVAKRASRAEVEEELEKERKEKELYKQELMQIKKKVEIQRQLRIDNIINISRKIGHRTSIILFILVTIISVIFCLLYTSPSPRD